MYANRICKTPTDYLPIIPLHFPLLKPGFYSEDSEIPNTTGPGCCESLLTLPRGGDRGAGDREKRGQEVYGRREKRGLEAGFPRWREGGEKG